MYWLNKSGLVTMLTIGVVMRALMILWVFVCSTVIAEVDFKQLAANKHDQPATGLESVGADLGEVSGDTAGLSAFRTSDQSIEDFKEDVIGFRVNKPSGWQIRYTLGVITILKDAQAREGVSIYPVRPKAGFSLGEFLSSYLNILKKLSTTRSHIEYSGLSSVGQRIQANVTGKMDGMAVKGVATAHVAGPDYVCTLYWAPVDVLSSEEKLLKRVADSYQRTGGQVLVRLSGSYFETMAPSGWRIEQESPNSVSFVNGSRDAGVTSGYMDFGGDPQPMTILRLFASMTTPYVPGQQPSFGFTTSYTRLAAVDLPDFRDALGRTWKARAEEFDGTLIGTPGTKVHGVLSGMVMNGRHITGLYGWIVVTAVQMSSPDAWERNAAATAIVQDKLKIINASELITNRILPKNNPYDSSSIMGQWAFKNHVDEELSRKRKEAIMGYETYRTLTGERVDVPVNSIPGGNNTIYWNPRTRTIWNSVLETPPSGSGYTPLHPESGY